MFGIGLYNRTNFKGAHEMVQTKIEKLIEQVEATFKEGFPYAYIETGRYKFYSTGTVRALKERGYRIERRVIGGAYHVYPKQLAPIPERTYVLPLTKGELIAIRELVRKFPQGSEFTELYAKELFHLDNMTTAKLSEIVDEEQGLKKS
jgi:hypothetical protein